MAIYQSKELSSLVLESYRCCQSVQETVVHLSNTVTTVVTHTSHRSCDEGWVTWSTIGRKLFVRANLTVTKFHNEIINEFLDF